MYSVLFLDNLQEDGYSRIAHQAQGAITQRTAPSAILLENNKFFLLFSNPFYGHLLLYSKECRSISAFSIDPYWITVPFLRGSIHKKALQFL